MPLVNAKCTNCGGTLSVDASKEAAICDFCGSPYIVEKAIQNYNYHITNNISAQLLLFRAKVKWKKNAFCRMQKQMKALKSTIRHWRSTGRSQRITPFNSYILPLISYV